MLETDYICWRRYIYQETHNWRQVHKWKWFQTFSFQEQENLPLCPCSLPLGGRCQTWGKTPPEKDRNGSSVNKYRQRMIFGAKEAIPWSGLHIWCCLHTSPHVESCSQNSGLTQCAQPEEAWEIFWKFNLKADKGEETNHDLGPWRFPGEADDIWIKSFNFGNACLQKGWKVQYSPWRGLLFGFEKRMFPLPMNMNQPPPPTTTSSKKQTFVAWKIRLLWNLPAFTYWASKSDFFPSYLKFFGYLWKLSKNGCGYLKFFGYLWKLSKNGCGWHCGRKLYTCLSYSWMAQWNCVSEALQVVAVSYTCPALIEEEHHREKTTEEHITPEFNAT